MKPFSIKGYKLTEEVIFGLSVQGNVQSCHITPSPDGDTTYPTFGADREGTAKVTLI